MIDIDVFEIFGDILDDPSSFGFDNVALPCLFPSRDIAGAFGQPFQCDNADAQTTLFFDAVHPNAAAHDLLAGIVRDRIAAEFIAPVPLPAGLPLLVAALALLAAFRRRRTA